MTRPEDLGPRGTAPASSAATAGEPPDIARARTLARVLDHGLVDPLLGLALPGIGDVLGSLLGLYLVAIAVRRRMSPVIVARMLLHLAVDAVLGAVPIAGDLADFAFRANRRNLDLLTRRHATGEPTAGDWLAVAGAAAVFAAAAALVIYGLAAVIRAVA